MGRKRKGWPAERRTDPAEAHDFCCGFTYFTPHHHTLAQQTAQSHNRIYIRAVLTPPDDAMSTPTPLAGRLVPLRTKDEVRASLETHSAYVVEVPAKFANVVKE